MDLSLVSHVASTVGRSAIGKAGEAVEGLVKKKDKEEVPLRDTTQGTESLQDWGDAVPGDLEPEEPKVSRCKCIMETGDRRRVFFHRDRRR